MSVQLREHQAAAVEAVLAARRSGRRSGLVVMPAGTGEELVAVAAAQRLHARSLFVADRDAQFRRFRAAVDALLPRVRVGLARGTREEWTRRRVVIASARSLAAGRLASTPSDHFELVAV